MAKKGFTLSEMLIVLVIIGVVSAVTIPMLSVKKKVGNFEANSLKCVKTELAANLASTACTAAIQKAQYGQEKSINTLAFLAINGKDINEKNAANAVLRQACDNGGDKACSYFVTACQRDSSLCDTGGVYDLKHYLNLPQDTNDYAKFLIYEKTKSFYDSNNTNIKTIVDNTCCPNLNMACTINGYSSCPWIKHYGGSQDEIGLSIALSGNYAYVSGMEASDTAGSWDIFVMKFKITDGSIEWKKRYGGANSETGSSIALSGNYIYVTGSELSDTVGSHDVFLMQLDLNGIVQWKKHYGGASIDVGNSVAVSGSDIYITGYEASDAQGGFDIFVMKVDSSNGSTAWKKHYGGADNEWGSSVAILNSCIYITGYGRSDTAGSYDIFVMQLNSNGVVQWKKRYGGAGEDAGSSIAASGSNLYVTGYETSDTAGSYDAFVMQLDLNGVVQWKKRYGGAAQDEGQSILVSGTYVYVTGLDQTDTTGDFDIYAMKLNRSNGTVVWKKHYGGIADEWGKGIALSGDYIYITGFEQSDADGNKDVFVMKLYTNQTTSNMAAGWNGTSINPANWSANGVAIVTPTTTAGSPWTTGASQTIADGIDINPASWIADGIAIATPTTAAGSPWTTGATQMIADGIDLNPANWTANGTPIKMTTNNSNYFTVGLRKDGVPIP